MTVHKSIGVSYWENVPIMRVCYLTNIRIGAGQQFVEDVSGTSRCYPKKIKII